jgi:sulfoxide reductase catalytic subunit YedY
MLIKIRKASDATSSEITPEGVYLNRRHFMKSAAVAGAGAVLGSYFGDAEAEEAGKYANVTKSPLSKLGPKDKVNKYEEISSYNNFYEFGIDKGEPAVKSKFFNTNPWTIEVDGMCKNKGKFDLDAFMKGLPVEERVYRMRCVEAWSMVIPWVGVPLADIVKRAEPEGSAKYIAFQTLFDPKQMPGQRISVLDWPYVDGLRLDEAMNPLAILAVGLYGKELPNPNGAPIRLVTPWKYGFKGIKSIVKISFTEDQPDCTWNLAAPREYGFYSNVNPKVDHPRWSQASERRIGEFLRRDTLMYNGYEEEVAHLYAGMDLAKYF